MVKKVLYEDFFEALEKNKVKYLAVGGIAVLIYGVIRVTVDLDLVIDLEEENIKKFTKVIKKFKYKWKIPVSLKDLMNPENIKKWIREKNLKAINFYKEDDPLDSVDLIVDLPFSFKEIYKRKKVVRIREDLSIKVISLKDLKRMKRKASRPKDLADVDALERMEKIEKD
jgi:molybdenum cofactor biosynthesis enzyme MoaA